MVAAAVENTVEGVVARVNERGVLLQGRTEWLNLSRYAKQGPLLPHVGMKVSLGLDKSGYIRTSTQRHPTAVREAEPEETASALLYLPDSQRTPELPQPQTTPDKDAKITRMNALTNAVAIASSGEQKAHLESVLGLAARLEQWVNR